MHRLSSAASLSLSILAVGLAGVAFYESRSPEAATDNTVARELESLADAVAQMRSELDDLSTSRGAAALRRDREEATSTPSKARKSSATGDERSESEELEATVAALAARIDTLDDAERIHLLAQSGRKEVERKKILGALSDLRSAEVAPEDRVRALETLRGMRKSNHREIEAAFAENEIEEADLAWPMIEIAKDVEIDADLRGEALQSLAGMKTEEIRQPLLEIFASEDASEVRVGAFNALAWHMEDLSVRRVLRGAANDVLHPEVRSRAVRLAPKLDYFDRRDAERAATASGTAGGESKAGE